ncbi:hypothetical protein EJ06DRAFT_526857 [Trichodelitschia bisporula]|uniref:Uncharacterized protein n=1 Tax=Trichodelitschia bisporula TaxID=703511 RepID=A0A6G1I905_9PEZI|nr:hypothetical protein EJ06DRAFT_526857 [Trichodelitschia bisporula]
MEEDNDLFVPGVRFPPRPQPLFNHPREEEYYKVAKPPGPDPDPGLYRILRQSCDHPEDFTSYLESERDISRNNLPACMSRLVWVSRGPPDFIEPRITSRVSGRPLRDVDIPIRISSRAAGWELNYWQTKSEISDIVDRMEGHPQLLSKSTAGPLSDARLGSIARAIMQKSYNWRLYNYAGFKTAGEILRSATGQPTKRAIDLISSLSDAQLRYQTVWDVNEELGTMTQRRSMRTNCPERLYPPNVHPLPRQKELHPYIQDILRTEFPHRTIPSVPTSGAEGALAQTFQPSELLGAAPVESIQAQENPPVPELATSDAPESYPKPLPSFGFSEAAPAEGIWAQETLDQASASRHVSHPSIVLGLAASDAQGSYPEPFPSFRFTEAGPAEGVQTEEAPSAPDLATSDAQESYPKPLQSFRLTEAATAAGVLAQEASPAPVLAISDAQESFPGRLDSRELTEAAPMERVQAQEAPNQGGAVQAVPVAKSTSKRAASPNIYDLADQVIAKAPNPRLHWQGVTVSLGRIKDLSVADLSFNERHKLVDHLVASRDSWAARSLYQEDSADSHPIFDWSGVTVSVPNDNCRDVPVTKFTSQESAALLQVLCDLQRLCMQNENSSTARVWMGMMLGLQN